MTSGLATIIRIYKTKCISKISFNFKIFHPVIFKMKKIFKNPNHLIKPNKLKLEIKLIDRDSNLRLLKIINNIIILPHKLLKMNKFQKIKKILS